VGGSGSIAHSFKQYRELGARTRAMLVAAAADQWHVSPDQCRTENSVVHGPGNRSARYAELAKDAASKAVPEQVRLKNPSEFRLCEKVLLRRERKSYGVASKNFVFVWDLGEMRCGVAAPPPVFGGRVKSFDDKDARKLDGVREVFEMALPKGSGVVVVADRFW